MSSSTNIKPEEIIDVDALPEWNHRTIPHPTTNFSRRHGQPAHSNKTAAIDLTTMDDSDSDISILSSMTGTPGPSNGRGREMNFPSTIAATGKIKKRSRPTANSPSLQSHSHTSVPPAKKLKISTPLPVSLEQSTSSIKLARGSSNNNGPVASTSTITNPTLLLSEVYLKLIQGPLSSDELAGIAHTMMSQLDPHSLPSSSRPTTTTPAASASRRKDKGKRTLACIELSSDGEELSFSKRQKYTARPSSSRKQIARPSTTIDIPNSDMGPDGLDAESDEESKYDHIHAGYDIHDPDIWTPMPVNLNRLQQDEEVVDNMKQLAISELEPRMHRPPRCVHPDISRWYPNPPKMTFPPVYIWDQLRLAKNLRFPARPLPTPLQPLKKPFTRPWDLDFNLHRLKAVHSFKESPGSINRIEQKGKWTIVASACTGGLPDTVDEQLSPYNRPGSLITWSNHLNIPEGHQLKKGDKIKYYAVHDLKFFPDSTSFVSTGADGTIRLWSLDDEDDDQHDAWFNQRLHTFNASPHDLSFKPQTSILAVAERKIHVFTFQDAQFEISAEFLFYPSRSPHVIGSLVWGFESTSDQLFGSSEPCLPTIFEGVHKALDVTTKKPLYHFDASEAGDMLSIDTTGATLALSTRALGNKHLLRIYDTRRKLPTATHLMELEPFPTRDGFEGEVNDASFSPDGTYLALARNDNHTHVYDRRMWGRGVIFDYDHGGESKAASPKDVYGVAKAQWVQSQATRRMALVTGGEDGCVRIWDPTMAAQNPKNGKVLGEVNSDIGHFSLGDPYTGENQLVVGDNTGEVTIFNNVVI